MYEWVDLFSKDQEFVDNICKICGDLSKATEENDHIKFIELWGRLDDKEKIIVSAMQAFELNKNTDEVDCLKLKIQKVITFFQDEEQKILAE